MDKSQSRNHELTNGLTKGVICLRGDPVDPEKGMASTDLCQDITKP